MTDDRDVELGPDPVADPVSLRETYRQQLLTSIGGWQGALITGIPPVVFVAVNATAGLRAAVITALAVAALLIVYRLVRKQSLQQAISGAAGVAVAALIAARTGQARGFFLLGIWGSFLYAVPLVVSLLVRRPAVGLVWEFLDPSPPADDGRPWFRRTSLFRAYLLATVAWTVTFLARGIVQAVLYHHNATGWLAGARLAMGYPLTIAAFGASWWLVRRARAQLAAAPGSAADDRLP
ncbi:MAG: DUF3159 domain-containing protein [Jatrophihabitans sp.]|uniref:DUF3159 domain-containing protein n=1 Tax=Jatrophihabitans sp. TaxID=1932789 RepID=UPI003F7F679A